MGGYTGAIYRCPDCGYTGPLVIETNDPIPSPKSEQERNDEMMGGRHHKLPLSVNFVVSFYGTE